MKHTYYYSRVDNKEYTTTLNPTQPTSHTAMLVFSEYILYKDDKLTLPIGKIFYSLTMVNSDNINYVPYSLTIFLNNGKNLTAMGAFDNPKDEFFPLGKVQTATITNNSYSCNSKYVDILRTDQNIRILTIRS